MRCSVDSCMYRAVYKLFRLINESMFLCVLLSQRENLVRVKFFDPEISMIFDISELPESKLSFLENVCVYVFMCVCVSVINLCAA